MTHMQIFKLFVRFLAHRKLLHRYLSQTIWEAQNSNNKTDICLRRWLEANPSASKKMTFYEAFCIIESHHSYRDLISGAFDWGTEEEMFAEANGAEAVIDLWDRISDEWMATLERHDVEFDEQEYDENDDWQ